MKLKSDWNGCPIRYAAGILGDPWTFVVMRDLIFKEKHHPRELGAEEGPASNILADRLAGLEAAGIIRRHRDPARRNQKICELTEKGLGLVPVFLAMIDWSARHDPATEVPDDYIEEYRSDPFGFADRLIARLSDRAGSGDRASW